VPRSFSEETKIRKPTRKVVVEEEGRAWGIGPVGGFGTSPDQSVVIGRRSVVVASWNDLVMSGKVLGDSMRALIVVGDMSQKVSSSRLTGLSGGILVIIRCCEKTTLVLCIASETFWFLQDAIVRLVDEETITIEQLV
jgi:hypothetical protein